MDFNISEELKKLPDSPGVYIMHDESGEIIYVGKAISLKNRVRQYFQASKEKTAKIEQMVSKINYFEYIVTNTELEALILENNLIKEHLPKYNTKLKDDKNYPYIKVTINDEFPKIIMTRQFKKDGGKYFGPFSSSLAVKNTIDIICKAYRLRTCHRSLPKDIGKKRPCLDYYINQCSAPCFGYINSEEYKSYVNKALDFLNGDIYSIVDELKKNMLEASGKEEFEQAAKYRDGLNSIMHIVQKQKLNSTGLMDRDIIAVASDRDDTLVTIFFVREGKVVGREHHYIFNELDRSRGDIIEDFMKQFYSGILFLPANICIQYDIPDIELIKEYLSKKRGGEVKITVPKKGEAKKLIELAYKNACLILSRDKERIRKEYEKTVGALNELGKLLNNEAINRIEAYDISNISGSNSVGSMVVYEDGKEKKSDYRMFKIKTVVGANDYASLEEVLTRRFKRYAENSGGFDKKPDLILMDGGKGQVNIAKDVINRYGLDIIICGMVKDDRHRTRGLYYNNMEIDLDSHSEAFKLITRIQDEAHRFAIEYHRNLATRSDIRSILDDISGIGKKRRMDLLKHFGSVENIAAANLSEIESVKGINKRLANMIYEYFKEREF